MLKDLLQIILLGCWWLIFWLIMTWIVKWDDNFLKLISFVLMLTIMFIPPRLIMKHFSKNKVKIN